MDTDDVYEIDHITHVEVRAAVRIARTDKSRVTSTVAAAGSPSALGSGGRCRASLRATTFPSRALRNPPACSPTLSPRAEHGGGAQEPRARVQGGRRELRLGQRRRRASRGAARAVRAPVGRRRHGHGEERRGGGLAAGWRRQPRGGKAVCGRPAHVSRCAVCAGWRGLSQGQLRGRAQAAARAAAVLWRTRACPAAVRAGARREVVSGGGAPGAGAAAAGRSHGAVAAWRGAANARARVAVARLRGAAAAAERSDREAETDRQTGMTRTGRPCLSLRSRVPLWGGRVCANAS
jgi:hypothetical protein